MSTTPRNLYFAPIGMSNAEATLRGLKQYLHGTAYNGGNAPTVGGVAGVTRGVFVPYQTQDGTWRLKFNLVVNSLSAWITARAVVQHQAPLRLVFKMKQVIRMEQDLTI